MKKHSLLLIMSLILGIAITACSGGGEKAKDADKQEVVEETPQEAEVSTPEQVTTPEDALAAQMIRGEEIYKEKCIVCHMADGKGVENAFPPLAKSDYLMADPVRAVAQTLNGSHEEMVVNGVTYNAPMTPQVDTKEDGIAVINYVMNNFENEGGTVTLEDVKDVTVNPR
ncbi:MAG: cytochrome c [Bacteroidota bacterium]